MLLPSLRVFALLLIAAPVFGDSILTGKVVSIADGDTLTILVEGQQHRIRLAEIDAPERKQPFGRKSRQTLSELCFRKEVEVVIIDKDRYGRLIGRVFAGMVDVNAEMVRRGMAWVYLKYAKDPVLFELEKIARSERRGLWAGEEPTPPWEWRRGKQCLIRASDVVWI